MRKNAFKNTAASFLLGFSCAFGPCSVEGAAASPIDECSRELLLSYFPEAFVNDTLKRFNIPEEKWAGINRSLANKDKDVVKLVEQKASAMSPNPLKDPQQRQAAVKLFRETLLQVFSEGLKENGVEDSHQFQAMLDDIQLQKAKKFAQCMENEKTRLEEQMQKEDKSSSKENKASSFSEEFK
jgi:hypothetical protein